jgi:hypothetical protein
MSERILDPKGIDELKDEAAELGFQAIGTC